MTEKTERLSREDMDVIATTSRDFWRGRLAELCSVVNDGRGQLEEVWTAFERRFGPELDDTVRSAVLRALGRER